MGLGNPASSRTWLFSIDTSCNIVHKKVNQLHYNELWKIRVKIYVTDCVNRHKPSHLMSGNLAQQAEGHIYQTEMQEKFRLVNFHDTVPESTTQQCRE